MTEESIYDEENVTEVVEESGDGPEEIQEEFSEAIVASKSPKQMREEKGVKKNSDGKVLTIKSVAYTKPRTKNQDGSKIPPKKVMTGDSEYYSGKLCIRFVEDDLIEYYPSISYWVNKGKINALVKINRMGNSKVSTLFREFICAQSKGKFKQIDTTVNDKVARVIPKDQEKAFTEFADDFSDSDFLNWLPGKKVEIKTSTGTYQGKTWFRNDITKFV